MNSKRTSLVFGKKYSLKNIDFIGPDELNSISSKLNLTKITKFPAIPFSQKYLSSLTGRYILILGQPLHSDSQRLTINSLREILGTNPAKGEPCFYNQDWYLKETFAKDKTLNFQWYIMNKNIKKKTRGISPQDIKRELFPHETFPSAILTAYTFFVYYFLSHGKILWENDFIWCSDTDSNGDRIYAGRYKDPNKINKNGFNIHRFLNIRENFGLSPQILGN